MPRRRRGQGGDLPRVPVVGTSISPVAQRSQYWRRNAEMKESELVDGPQESVAKKDWWRWSAQGPRPRRAVELEAK